MKYSEFTDDMLKEIIDAIKSKLLKLGINADVFVTSSVGRYGTEYIEVSTEKFNTTPVIYKYVTIGGKGSFWQSKDDDGVYNLDIPLDYWFKYFDGGTNGASIGIIQFRIFEKSQRVVCLGLTI